MKRKIFKKINITFKKLRDISPALKDVSIDKKSFLLLYLDGTWERIYFKEDLLDRLENDNNKRIIYIFDNIDKILIDRDIQINLGE